MSLRKKIITGFLCLGALLLLSGIITYLELQKLSRSSDNMVRVSLRNVELSKKMLDGAQQQNRALANMVIEGINPENEAILFSGGKEFEAAFSSLDLTAGEMPAADSVYAAYQRYARAMQTQMDKEEPELPARWFAALYDGPYRELSAAIDNIGVIFHENIDREARQIGADSYRAIRPGILALGLAALMILLFYFFLESYFIKPIYRIKNGLGRYLINRTPFDVKTEGKTEITELKENIEELIKQLRSRKTE